MFDLFIKPFVSFIFGKPKKNQQSGKSKVKIPKLYYEKFTITNFKGIKKVEISFVRNDLLLLLGLNESGKTTILKAIESFDYQNDPEKEFKPKHFDSLKRKSDVHSETSAKVTARIRLEDKLQVKGLKEIGKHQLNSPERQQVESFIDSINEEGYVDISRVFPFKEGNAQPYYYQIEHKSKFAQTELARLLAIEIVSIAPFIIYFEDFKDRIPENIYVNQTSDSFDPIWYDIIDGLFYNTDESYSIERFKQFFKRDNMRVQDSRIVLKKVNKELNKTFTKNWKNLSGVKGIESAEILYNEKSKSFQLSVYDVDGSGFTPEERSRGAIWYLSFLMKTEFRSKKLRKSSGTPVYLIDEPASNLHSTAQQNMAKDFHKIAKDTSIVYTTHSQYLITLENIRNTYIIRKSNQGVVSATPWSKFLSGKSSRTTYYQPIADLLGLVPNSMTIPWNKVWITEGVSDRKVLIVLSKVLGVKIDNLVIYPGTSAFKLSELISLNLGWNSTFKVLLDSDQAGLDAGKYYETDFGISDIVYLPKSNNKIEKCFTPEEKKALYELAFGETPTSNRISKKEFDAIFSLLIIDNVGKAKISNVLSEETKNLFTILFEKLKL